MKLRPWRRKVTWYLWDAEAPRWWPASELAFDALTEKGLDVLCWLFDHEVDDDQCMMPAHRYCVLCNRPFPNGLTRRMEPSRPRPW